MDEKYLTIGEVARIIGRSPSTIKNWYEWYNEQSDEVKQVNPLPEYRTDRNEKGTRFFRESDIEILEKFRDSISYGKMAEISRQKWGKRN